MVLLLVALQSFLQQLLLTAMLQQLLLVAMLQQFPMFLHLLHHRPVKKCLLTARLC